MTTYYRLDDGLCTVLEVPENTKVSVEERNYKGKRSVYFTALIGTPVNEITYYSDQNVVTVRVRENNWLK